MRLSTRLYGKRSLAWAMHIWKNKIPYNYKGKFKNRKKPKLTVYKYQQQISIVVKPFYTTYAANVVDDKPIFKLLPINKGIENG